MGFVNLMMKENSQKDFWSFKNLYLQEKLTASEMT